MTNCIHHLRRIVLFVCVAIVAVLRAALPAAADETTTFISAGKIEELLQAAGSTDSEAAVSLVVDTPLGSRAFTLVLHELRSRSYRSSKLTETPQQETFFFRSPTEETDEEFARITLLIDPASGEPELRGFLAVGGKYFSMQPTHSPEAYRVVGSEGYEPGAAASCHAHEAPLQDKPTARSSRRERALSVLELATEADFEYVQFHGSASAANAEILAIVNAADAIYRRELGIRIEVTFQHAWETAADPYTSQGQDESLLLNEFRQHWEQHVSALARYDAAHLFSGRFFSAGGTAFVGSVCDAFRYGVSRSEALQDAIVIFAHEVGHVLGADHDDCTSASEWIMCSGSSHLASSFSPQSKNAILADLDNVSCLEFENSAPVFVEPLHANAIEGEILSFQLRAVDADSDNLQYLSLSPLPPGATLDRLTGLFSWRPAANQAGDYRISIEVRDPQNLDTADLTVSVVKGDSAPSLPPQYALGDYNGDGATDFSIYRNPTGQWASLTAAGETARENLQLLQFGLPGDVPVVGDFNGDRISDETVFRPSAATWYFRYSGTQHISSAAFGLAGDIPVPSDYDGDGRSDLAVFRPLAGLYIIKYSSTGIEVPHLFGLSGDIPVPCDYDADGAADLAVYRPNFGLWIIRTKTGDHVSQFGLPTDHPLPANFAKRGQCEIAVWRPSSGEWFQKNGAHIQFGLPGDVPIVGDFDGDSLAEIGVWRPGSASWFINDVALNVQFGLPTDILPLRSSYFYATRLSRGDTRLIRNGEGNTANLYEPKSGTYAQLSIDGIATQRIEASTRTRFMRGDYDGDGFADVAGFIDGFWNIRLAKSASLSIHWGIYGDIPESGDFDGDGKSDIVVFRPDAGGGFSAWYVIKSGTGLGETFQFGLSGDSPIATDFNGDGFTDAGVFRPSTGRWFIRDTRSAGLTESVQWGLPGDIPRIVDFDGDGRPDKSVYRSGFWYILYSGGGIDVRQWGLPGDIPVPNYFIDNQFAELAVFRPTNATLYVVTRSGIAITRPTGLFAHQVVTTKP